MYSNANLWSQITLISTSPPSLISPYFHLQRSLRSLLIPPKLSVSHHIQCTWNRLFNHRISNQFRIMPIPIRFNTENKIILFLSPLKSNSPHSLQSQITPFQSYFSLNLVKKPPCLPVTIELPTAVPSCTHHPL